MKFLIFSLIGLMLSVSVCTASETEQRYSPQELKAAKAKLRVHNRLWTFEEGAILGREWTSRAPEDAELRALYARQLLGQLDGHREIQEQADAILAREPDNPWGLYAQALAFLTDRQYSDEATESSLRAWKLLPRPEFAAAHLQSLRFRNAEAGTAFLDSVDAETLQHPEVLHARAELEYWAQYRLEDSAYADTSLATLATLRARWPDHVSGYFSAAQQLYRSNKPQEALSLIEEAVRLAPGSADVRYLHWQLLNETDQLPAIEAGIAEYRKAVPQTVRGLALLTTAYRNVLEDEEQAAAFEAKLMALAPAGRHASRIHQEKFEREYRRLQAELERIGHDAPEYQSQLRLICDAAYRFLEKPLYDDSFRERPYRALFSSLSAMNPVPAEELAEAVRDLIQYEQSIFPYLMYSALILMADHTPYAEEAAAIARDLIQTILDRAEEEAWEERPNYYLGLVHDALGWALYKAGRVEEGRAEIERALEFSPRNTRAHYHLGQVFEQMATEVEATDTWLDKAADAYVAGLEVRSWGPNPCQAALVALYERRHGSREGFDEYLAALRGGDSPTQIDLTPKVDLHLEPVPVEGLPNHTLNLPPGFKVKLFSDQVDKARFMAWDDQGVLHVANMKPRRGNTWSPASGRQSTVLALPDKDGDGRADTVYKAADDLRWPHSIAFYQGALFVADDAAIYRLEDRDADGFYEERAVFAEVPGIMGRAYEHVTHTLVFDESNDELYFHVGAGCDICREDDPERSAVIQMNTDGTGRRIYAAGLRNAIGLALHPVTGELWAANTGHDREGPDLPPEWITPLRDGGFYGWPLAYGDKVWTDFSIRSYRRSIFPLTSADSLLVANMDTPAVLIPAHLAPMGLHFYEHDQFPPQYKHAAFVACRAGALGSDPGYKVMVLFAEPDGSNARIADFLTGFRSDSDEDAAPSPISSFFSFNSANVWGKPVGLTADEAGHLYLTSDENTQAIFRIEHGRE